MRYKREERIGKLSDKRTSPAAVESLTTKSSVINSWINSFYVLILEKFCMPAILLSHITFACYDYRSPPDHLQQEWIFNVCTDQVSQCASIFVFRFRPAFYHESSLFRCVLPTLKILFIFHQTPCSPIYIYTYIYLYDYEKCYALLCVFMKAASYDCLQFSADWFFYVTFGSLGILIELEKCRCFYDADVRLLIFYILNRYVLVYCSIGWANTISLNS